MPQCISASRSDVPTAVHSCLSVRFCHHSCAYSSIIRVLLALLVPSGCDGNVVSGTTYQHVLQSPSRGPNPNTTSLILSKRSHLCLRPGRTSHNRVKHTLQNPGQHGGSNMPTVSQITLAACVSGSLKIWCFPSIISACVHAQLLPSCFLCPVTPVITVLDRSAVVSCQLASSSCL